MYTVLPLAQTDYLKISRIRQDAIFNPERRCHLESVLEFFLIDNAYGIFTLVKTFLDSFFRFEDFAKQANLNVSSGFCSSFFFCSAVLGFARKLE